MCERLRDAAIYAPADEQHAARIRMFEQGKVHGLFGRRGIRHGHHDQAVLKQAPARARLHDGQAAVYGILRCHQVKATP